LSHDRCDVRKPSGIAPPAQAAMNANRYVSFTVLEIVATAVSLIDSLGRTVPKLSNNIPLLKNYHIIVSKMLRKWQNMQKILISQQ